MQVKIFRIVFAAAVSFVLAASASAQTGALRGKVTDENGQPVKDAMVYIERQGVRGNYKVKTRKRGDYFHAGLPLGTYVVRLEIDGKEVQTVSNYRLQMSDDKPLNFDLAKIRQEQNAARAAGGPSKDQLAAMSEKQRKEYEKALKERQKQLTKNKELNAAFNTGMEALRLKDYPVAVTNLKRASEIDAEQDVVWANLAEAYSKLAGTKTGDDRTAARDASIDAYRKALALKPDAAYHNNLGLALIRAGNMEEGQAELQTAAELDPANAGRYYFNLGAVMVNGGDAQGAIDAFRKATEMQPDYADAYYQLATALVGTATMKEDGSVVPAPGTVEAYQKYLELQPGGPYAASAQAMVQSLSGTLETTFENPKKKKKKS